jgi:hypothetical protein
MNFSQTLQKSLTSACFSRPFLPCMGEPLFIFVTGNVTGSSGSGFTVLFSNTSYPF